MASNRGRDYRGVRLDDGDFSGARLHSPDFEGAKPVSRTQLPLYVLFTVSLRFDDALSPGTGRTVVSPSGDRPCPPPRLFLCSPACCRCASATTFSRRELIAFPLQPITDLAGELGAATDVDVDELVALLYGWLHRTRKSDREILSFCGIGALDELSRSVADKLLTRLQEVSQVPL